MSSSITLMKPDRYVKSRYVNPVGPLILSVLLFFNAPLWSQVNNTKMQDSGMILPDTIKPAKSRLFLINDSLTKNHQIIISPEPFVNNANSGFYNSLKAKASKHMVTKKLYDFVVVSNYQPLPAQAKSRSSESDYEKYSGKKIGKVTVQRLNVFGTDINRPQYMSQNKVENILNKTHLNTNEFIIRKNLLFSEGDTVSPLILSDNERLLRQLPFIDDSRILVVPVSDSVVNIVVVTKDLYSLGASVDLQSINAGSVAVFDKNILGLGNEFKITVPYNPDLPDSPGFGVDYIMSNIRKTFIDLDVYYYSGLGQKTYGFSLSRKLVSSTTRYAGGISVREMFTSEDLDTLPKPEPLKYNLQDYWFERSFLLNKESVTRLIIGVRYTNNNVFDRPFILPDSYHYLQSYRMYLGSLSLSVRKYYKTSLLYAYGRTEDIPYGGLLTFTAGREINEFKMRTYLGCNISAGESLSRLGYLYASAGLSSFLNGSATEEGMFLLRSVYFTNLLYLGDYKMRNFVKADYTRGFDRYTDEYITFTSDGSFTGFRNDTIGGLQRLSLDLESVLFSPRNFYGFRFAFFASAGVGYLFGYRQPVISGDLLTSIGIGVRIRNDNLLFNTIQISLNFYPDLPPYSKVNYLYISGEQLLKPDDFDPGPPSIMLYQ
jgi:hypothetical protein